MASLKETAQYYPDVHVKYDRNSPFSFYGEPDPVTLDVLGRLKGTVLEVGAGDGRYTHPMLEQGLEVVASDVSAEALDVLRYKVPERQADRLETVIFNAFEPFPFEERKFDAVVSTAFLYLYPEKHIREFMEGAHQVLRNDGLLVVDFATNRKRTDKYGNELKGKDEVQYTPGQGMIAINNARQGLFGDPLVRESAVDQNLSEYRMQAHKLTILLDKISL